MTLRDATSLFLKKFKKKCVVLDLDHHIENEDNYNNNNPTIVLISKEYETNYLNQKAYLLQHFISNEIPIYVFREWLKRRAQAKKLNQKIIDLSYVFLKITYVFVKISDVFLKINNR